MTINISLKFSQYWLSNTNVMVKNIDFCNKVIVYVYTYTHICSYSHAHMFTNTCSHKEKPHKHKCSQTQTCSDMCLNTLICTHTFMLIHNLLSHALSYMLILKHTPNSRI